MFTAIKDILDCVASYLPCRKKRKNKGHSTKSVQTEFSSIKRQKIEANYSSSSFPPEDSMDSIKKEMNTPSKYIR